MAAVASKKTCSLAWFVWAFFEWLQPMHQTMQYAINMAQSRTFTKWEHTIDCVTNVVRVVTKNRRQIEKMKSSQKDRKRTKPQHVVHWVHIYRIIIWAVFVQCCFECWIPTCILYFIVPIWCDSFGLGIEFVHVEYVAQHNIAPRPHPDDGKCTRIYNLRFPMITMDMAALCHIYNTHSVRIHMIIGTFSVSWIVFHYFASRSHSSILHIYMNSVHSYLFKVLYDIYTYTHTIKDTYIYNNIKNNMNKIKILFSNEVMRVLRCLHIEESWCLILYHIRNALHIHKHIYTKLCVFFVYLYLLLIHKLNKTKWKHEKKNL